MNKSKSEPSIFFKIETAQSDDGRSWIVSQDNVLCAVCRYIQLTKFIRKDDVIFACLLQKKDETHAKGCKQDISFEARPKKRECSCPCHQLDQSINCDHCACL